MKNKIIKLAVSIIICQGAGIAGSFFTASAIPIWYAALAKPFFVPPSWLFAPAWTILFLLMGISLYLVWEKKFKVRATEGQEIPRAWNPISQKLFSGSWKEENIIAIFALQLALNILWSVIFFGLKLPAVAFAEILMLWFAILYTIVNFYRVSKPAAYLLIPYIAWVTFAAILNFSIARLN